MRTVAGVAAIMNNSLLLVRKGEFWIPPGGKHDTPEESDFDCIRRECKEELPGCTVSDLEPLAVWPAVTPHRGDTIKCRIYLGRITGSIQTNPDPNESVKEARWIPNAELDNYQLSDGTQLLVDTLRFTGRLT